MNVERSRAVLRGLLPGLLLVAALAACRLPPPSVTPATGARAPNFELTTADGARFHLAAELGDGPLLLVFYRGHW